MSIKIIDLVLKSSLPPLRTDKGKLVTAPVAKLVLLTLASHADPEGRDAYPSASRLCQETGFSLPTVLHALNALRTNGYIELSGRTRWQTNNYAIRVEKLMDLNPVESRHSTGLSPATKPGLENPSLNRPLNPLVDDGSGEIFSAYEREIGPLTFSTRGSIEAWLTKDIPRAWILEAITLAARNNSRRWSYVQAILRNWKSTGKTTRKGVKHADHSQNPRGPAPQPRPEDLELARRINDLRRMRRLGPPPRPPR